MKLARREKYLVTIAGGVIFLLIIHGLIIEPFFDKKERLQQTVRTKEETLEEILIRSAEYKSLKKGDKGLHSIMSNREQGFTLFSFLEQQAAKSDVKGHMKYMKPSVSQGTGPYKESIVEIKLEGITLKQLVGYLYRIESPEKLISIQRLSIKKNTTQAGHIDTVLKIMTFQ